MQTFTLPEVETVLRESSYVILWQAGEVEDDNGEPTLEMWEERHDLDGLCMADKLHIVTSIYNFIDSAHLMGLEEYLEKYDWGQLIHDYWITRNGHGAGFWDRGLGEDGERLSSFARQDGEYEVFELNDHPNHRGALWGFSY